MLRTEPCSLTGSIMPASAIFAALPLGPAAPTAPAKDENRLRSTSGWASAVAVGSSTLLFDSSTPRSCRSTSAEDKPALGVPLGDAGSSSSTEERPEEGVAPLGTRDSSLSRSTRRPGGHDTTKAAQPVNQGPATASEGRAPWCNTWVTTATRAAQK
jgi:hypothetical protein